MTRRTTRRGSLPCRGASLGRGEPAHAAVAAAAAAMMTAVARSTTAQDYLGRAACAAGSRRCRSTEQRGEQVDQAAGAGALGGDVRVSRGARSVAGLGELAPRGLAQPLDVLALCALEPAVHHKLDDERQLSGVEERAVGAADV